MEFFFPIIIGGVIGMIIYAAKNAGKSNAPKEYMYQCSQARFIEALKKGVSSVGYDIEKIDPIGGRARIGVGTSMTSFGEWIDVQMMETAPEKTKVVVSCQAKHGRENIGKNNKNIEKLMDAVSAAF